MSNRKQTARIIYWNYAGKEFEKSVTGTVEEIEAEADRLRSLPDVAGVRVEW